MKGVRPKDILGIGIQEGRDPSAAKSHKNEGRPVWLVRASQGVGFMGVGLCTAWWAG